MQRRQKKICPKIRLICYNQKIMGQITIEIPQKLNRNYRILSEDDAEEFLLYVENLIKAEEEEINNGQATDEE